jgi:hypothetical protein
VTDVTRPSRTTRVAACCALGASTCVATILLAGFVASPTGMLVVLAFFLFASAPGMIGGVLAGVGGVLAWRGRRPVGILAAAAGLLVPAGAFATWVGTLALHPRSDTAPGTVAASWVALVAAPLAVTLALTAVVLLGWRSVRRRAMPLLAGANSAVLLVATSVALASARPG